MLDPQSCPFTSNQYLCEADALVYAGIQAYTMRPIFLLIFKTVRDITFTRKEHRQFNIKTNMWVQIF